MLTEQVGDFLLDRHESVDISPQSHDFILHFGDIILEMNQVVVAKVSKVIIRLLYHLKQDVVIAHISIEADRRSFTITGFERILQGALLICRCVGSSPKKTVPLRACEIRVKKGVKQ